MLSNDLDLVIARHGVFTISAARKHPDVYSIRCPGSRKSVFAVIFSEGRIVPTALEADQLRNLKPHIYQWAQNAIANHRGRSAHPKGSENVAA